MLPENREYVILYENDWVYAHVLDKILHSFFMTFSWWNFG